MVQVERTTPINKEWSKITVRCGHSGTIEDLSRNFSVYATIVQLEDSTDGVCYSGNEKAFITSDYATPEEVSKMIEIFASWHDRYVKGEKV